MYESITQHPLSKLARALCGLILVGMGAYFVFGEDQAPAKQSPKTLEEFAAQKNMGTLSYSADEAGKPVLVNTFTVARGTYEAMDHAKNFLSGLQEAHLHVVDGKVVRFVAQTPLVDRLGHETSAPVLQFEFDLQEMQTANYKNLGALSMARQVKDVEVLHPAITEDIVQFCNEIPQQVKVSFCFLSAFSLVQKHWVPQEG
ncbi:hypothetical protein ABT392_14525 [Paucibacter sp. JuS9]|uniref:hypothetical protein n=1 Tax=Paucibacter sp. JuS9 TaxID=3228748 RepID=UPI003757797E